MAYTKTNWVNGTTPINATNLNHIEDGIESVEQEIPSVYSTPRNTSTTDEVYNCGYINYIEANLKGTVLYDNSAGTTGNITLSDSASNYNYLEIYYKTNDSGSASSQKITGMSSGTKIANLLYIWFVQGSYYFKQANVNINGTSITFSNNNQWGNNAPIEGGNFIYITKVVGYK